jgi:DNA-binding NarL/FixJ family response regulator
MPRLEARFDTVAMIESTRRTENPSPSVVIVDPDDRMRESLTGLLRIGDRCLVAGSAGDSVHALAIAADLRPDAVILDERVVEADSGARLVAELRSILPSACLIVMGRSEAGVVQLPVGVDAYVRKTYRSHELIGAVLAACRPLH